MKIYCVTQSACANIMVHISGNDAVRQANIIKKIDLYSNQQSYNKTPFKRKKMF